jgi:hypothetical protein
MRRDAGRTTAGAMLITIHRMRGRPAFWQAPGMHLWPPGNLSEQQPQAALDMMNFEDIAVIDASVLDTPLDANEQAEGRDTIATQYRQNP